MNQEQFIQLSTAIDSLSPSQRHLLLERLQYAEAIPGILDQLEQNLQSHLKCPKCYHELIHRWGTFKGMQRYRCCGCRKTFKALTDTPLTWLRKRELWMEYAQSMLDSESLRKAAARCGIHLTTAFRWRHRFLKLADQLNATEFTGIVEADQTMFRETFKGQRKITKRPARKRGGDNKSDTQWVSVLVVSDRSADEADFVINHFTLKNVEVHLIPLFSRDIVLCTDGHLTFEAFTGKHHFEHKVLNASDGERVKETAFHIQRVNNYHQRLKGWIQRFNGVATKYLPHYLGWFRLFDQQRSGTLQPFDFMSDLVTT